MIQVALAEGSLTDGAEEVLVNASNTNCILGSGVSGAISRSCGHQYQQQILLELKQQRGGPMLPGQVLITHAGEHRSAKWIAHVAVMDYREGFTGSSFPTAETIRAGCEQLWPAIEAIPGAGPLSVAMVALGGGTGNLGVRVPTAIAAETLKAHPAKRIEKVVFYGHVLQEYIAIAEVLLEHFPDLRERLAPEVLDFLARVKP